MPFKASVSGSYASLCIIHQIAPPLNSQQHSPDPLAVLVEKGGEGNHPGSTYK